MYTYISAATANKTENRRRRNREPVIRANWWVEVNEISCIASWVFGCLIWLWVTFRHLFVLFLLFRLSLNAHGLNAYVLGPRVCVWCEWLSQYSHTIRSCHWSSRCHRPSPSPPSLTSCNWYDKQMNISEAICFIQFFAKLIITPTTNGDEERKAKERIKNEMKWAANELKIYNKIMVRARSIGSSAGVAAVRETFVFFFLLFLLSFELLVVELCVFFGLLTFTDANGRSRIYFRRGEEVCRR